MIPLHKYSYPYLGQFKFSPGAFMLLVAVITLQVKLTCGKFNWMIFGKAHVLIKDLTADDAYQSKIQAFGVKRTAGRAQKQVCIKPHIWLRI